jgi:hypothetical protein
MRNEKILQLIAYYFSIDGNIINLYNELTNMNCIIDELFTNFIMNNIYIIIYDKNLTPSQMINNFMNFDNEKYNEIQPIEDEISGLQNYIQQLNKRKEKIHNKFVTFCKDKYEIKSKYFQLNNKGKNINEEIDFNLNKMVIEEEKKNDDFNNIKNSKISKSKDKDKIKETEHNDIDKSINDDGNNILTDIETGNNYSIKTRKKEKIMYFDNKYYKRGKKFKKILRKKKSALVGKARKYYIEEIKK